MIVTLKDLKCTMIQEDETFKEFPLAESCYYRSLSEGKDIYNWYLSRLESYFYKRKITENDEISYEGFHKLCLSLNLGFESKDPKIHIKDKVILDGQHRCSVLYYRDPDSYFILEDEKVVEWVR